jgi:pyridoxal 5'-phosphate synthase pdxS subunit
MMMQLGCDGVFVGSGIFKSENPKKMAKAIVDATMNFDKPEILAKVSEDLGSAMDSLQIEELDVKLAERGW